ncbi:Carnitinyl-CoA dehydratase [Ruegeria sp. THAF57]|uniref:enoyl-CoA hydratase n=1 Tax=Ruegeria sp. THAF57 TaxID=2744555 RepID=UPI0015DFA29A|nr:enoyl-CoA hydratase [Ruegeria sp. THAF57]CAD0187234.1 Carnitinyl-CoA dehydratase [Ruegeria sp. THAF57]
MTQDAPKNGQIIVERLGAVLRLTMDNSGKKNAISREMYLQMVEALDSTAEDHSIRAVWLRGADGVFSSGNDVNGFNAPKGEEPAPVQFVRSLINYPKPIVAQVEGLAVGIGVTLLLHCDIIYAADDTKFRMPFVNLGVVPEAGSSYLLPRLMGAPRAAELILLGRVFGAAEAHELGLISRVLPQAEVADAAEQAVTALSKQPLRAMMKSRALLRDVSGEALTERVAEEFRQFFEGLQGPEFAEAARAFMEKREPDFSKIAV